jgi:hypothetical protein
MSIAWTRIVPSGLPNSPINAAGVAFYKTVITELLKQGIVPAVTMFHCGFVGGWRLCVWGGCCVGAGDCGGCIGTARERTSSDSPSGFKARAAKDTIAFRISRGQLSASETMLAQPAPSLPLRLPPPPPPPPPPPSLPPGDLPQALQEKTGGFLAEGGAFQDAFTYYADTLFRELGPLVKLWMT